MMGQKYNIFTNFSKEFLPFLDKDLQKSLNRFNFAKNNHLKRARNILLIFSFVVISISTILFFTINSKYVQNKLAQHVTGILSEKLGNRISTGSVRVSGFNKVTVHDLLITDVQGDTILLTSELICRLNLLAFSSRNIELRKAVLNRADIRFAIDPESEVINIKFIIDQLKSKDTTLNKPKWIFGIQTIELNDCRFSFKNISKPFDRPFGMDYADLDISNLNLLVSDFRPAGDSLGGVKFRIRRLSCIEKCGLDLKFMSADFAVNRNNLSFKNVHIVTSLSEIEAKDASFLFDSFQDFSGDNFVSKVIMSMDIRSSEVAFCDLSYFVPYFSTYSDKVMVSGKVTGTVENLKGEKLIVHFGDMTQIYGNFDLKGLPQIRSTFIYADFTGLTTCPQDIERIQSPESHTGHVNLPENMHRLDTITFKGNFTGFYDDFVTYGTFTTNLGNLSTDLSIKPVKGGDVDTAFTFRGTMKTEKFHLGKLLTQNSIGEINMSGMVEGSAFGKGNIYALLEGQIGKIDMRGYEYRDITVNGAVNNRTYDGQLSIDEPNIKMDFSGKLDLNHAFPAYDFWANVEHAKLHNLKLVKSDTSSFAAFNIEAAFSGTNIDNLSGDLKLKNSLFRRNGREIEINDLILFTKSIRDTNNFILRSDILDAEIRGEYQFLKLPESFFSMVKNFAPAWIPISVSPDNLSHNNFRFEAIFKETQKLTDFFVNEFRVSRGSRISGTYNPSHRDVHFSLDVPFMALNGKQWRGLYMNGSIEDSAFVVKSGCAAFRINKNLFFDDPVVSARTRGDSVSLDIKWSNRDSMSNKGFLSSMIFFQKKPEKPIPSIQIISSPGQIITAGDVWTLTHQGISIDSTTIRLNNIRAVKDNQEILVSGIVSQNEQENLGITVRNLDLSVINSSMQFDKLLFGGIANGSASLSNLYEVPVFVSDIHIEDFSLNDSPFGNTDLAASWNSVNRSIRIEAESLLNDLHTLQAKGDYFISNQALNFDVSLEKVPVKILQPYLENVFTGLEGTLSGKMKLTGAIDNPLMNGSIEIGRAALTLDYTKTRYKFEGATTVKDNAILFAGIELFDQFNNSCKITYGFISITHFRDIAYELQFQANNLEVLNTRERDNNLFYGRAFATGNIRIRGNPQDMQLDIFAKTEKNTRFSIPLSSNDEVARTNFISFVDHTPRAQQRSQELQRRRVADTSGEPVPETKFNVNITMDVTPDAEAQLIFDAKIGDVIRARGNGTLRLNISNTRFDMAGTYTIQEGDYLFTLQNLIAKHFTIEKGGSITWSGDPMGALLDLKATYIARPSLYDLMNDENFRRSVPVECNLYITNKMTNPNVRFDLNMPNASQEVRSFLNAAANSEEEMTQQFLSLLVANRFFPDPNQSTRSSPTGSGLETMGLATASEFLTSQLSHMLSQWNDLFDVDISYRPGTENTGQVFEGSLGTNWWNFQAHYELAPENSENVGEFTFDVKVPWSDKLRLKVFNRANATYLSQNPYTQGIGLLFREDFNQVSDLFKRKKSPAIRRDEENEIPDNENIDVNEEHEKSTTVSVIDTQL